MDDFGGGVSCASEVQFVLYDFEKLGGFFVVGLVIRREGEDFAHAQVNPFFAGADVADALQQFFKVVGSGDGADRRVVCDGRMPPSGVVTGFRRDVACNVSKTKNRIAPRNVVLTQNAKSRLHPLGGLKPALRPPSGINTGLVKRRKHWARQAGTSFLPHVYGGRCPKGGREDKVARRRKCWVRQAG